MLLAAAQKQLVGPERSGGHDHHRGLDLARLDALRRIGISPREAHQIAAVAQWLDQLRGVQRPDLRPVALGDRKVCHVHCVFGVGGAAKSAVAREIARQLAHPAVRVRARGARVHPDRHQLRLAPESPARIQERVCARRQHATLGRTEGLRAEHHARQPVVRLQPLEADRAWPPLILEDARRRLDMNVEVMQRPAADAAALDHVHLLERAILDQPKAPSFDVPEPFPHDLARRAREIGRSPPAAPLEHAHRTTRLRQTARENAASKARPDHHCIQHDAP